MSNTPRLRAGQPAPRFRVPRVYGEPFDFDGQLPRRTLLAFHRYASCPICNFSLQQFSRRLAELDSRGVDYVAIFHSPLEKMRQFYPEDPGHDLLISPDMALYRTFGLQPSIRAFAHPGAIRDGLKALAVITRPDYDFQLAPDGSMGTRPADFLIAPDGTIEVARYGASAGDSLNVDEVLALL